MEERGHDHDNPPACWCIPDEVFEFQGRQVWVHKAPGEELIPADVIAEAIYKTLLNQ